MQVTDAIKAAKEYIELIYADEGVFNVGLEEIELDDDETWTVTIGFSRRWDRAPRNPFSSNIGERPDDRATSRTYKIVEISDSTGEITAVRNRVGLA